MVAPPTKRLEWQILLPVIPLDTSARHSAVHGCQWDHRLGCVLRQPVAARQVVPTSGNSQYRMEGVVRHCRCMRLLGVEWQRMRILVYCDNEAVVACLTSGTSRSPPPPPVMSLLRDLFHICALFGFMLSAKHIPGVTNKAADALSRFDLQGFRRAVPTANPSADKLKSV